MKRQYKVLLFTLFIIAVCSQSSIAKIKVVPKMYLCGVAYSFEDTIIYVTSVQELDSAWIDTKTHFLSGRNYYSYQLKEYFSAKDNDKRVCAVFFAEKRKDLEKKYIKMMKKFSKKGNVDVKQIPDTEFRFKAETPAPEDLVERPELTKAERKALKDTAKKSKKKPSPKKPKKEQPTKE